MNSFIMLTDWTAPRDGQFHGLRINQKRLEPLRILACERRQRLAALHEDPQHEYG
ncbi:hypothetical protein IHE31_00490 (plasmid) [Mycetohabitans rhizoxinica]